MRLAHEIRFFSALAFVIVCTVWLFTGSASAVEVSTLPSETVDLSDQTVPAETVAAIDSAADPTAADSGIALYAVPDPGTDFAGLAYFDVKSNLGSIRLYLPQGVSKDAVQLQDGMLYNVTNSTLYFYCREYPGYTFSASRFQNVSYRASNYDTQDLTVTEVTASGMVIDDYFDYVIIFCLVFIALAMIWRGKRD